MDTVIKKNSDPGWIVTDSSSGLSVRPPWTEWLWKNHLALMCAWQVDSFSIFPGGGSGKL